MDSSDMFSSSGSSDCDSQDSKLSNDIMGIANHILPTTLVNLEGLHSGVPTRTTPTLTPTTLRNIEQTIIELQCETESHQNEAGFVPPLVQPLTTAGSNGTFLSMVDSKAWQGGGITSISSPPPSRASVLTCLPGPSPPMSVTSQTSTQPPAPATRRNVGGRRPNKNTGITPEEEERRRVRRERNKMAAARCRKRRMDHTNSLLQETEGLEQKKQSLQTEITTLQMQKEELEFLLEAHRATPGCRLRSPASPSDGKAHHHQQHQQQQQQQHQHQHQQQQPLTRVRVAETNQHLSHHDLPPPMKRPRPSTLAVPPAFAIPKSMSCETVAGGVPISTPSNGLPFNFDSLMDGGTGLTPVSGPLVPSCSSQQRSTAGGCVDLSSPDAVPPKLVSL